MKTKRKSQVIEEAGQRVRVYTRSGARLYYSVVVGREDGRTKHRARSLKTRDWDTGLARARRIAQRLARAERTGARLDRLTLAELRDLYLRHRGPLLSKRRRRFMRHVLHLFGEHLGGSFPVTDFAQHSVETYVEARRSGRVMPDDRRAKTKPANGTLRNELAAFSTVCAWATTYRVEGTPLLPFNPVKGLDLPTVTNPSRPVASEARYEALLAVADEVEPTGRFRTLLVLAWHTGRRINAILHLRASDVFFTGEALQRALAEEGQDERLGEAWGGGLRWRPEWDKLGYLDFSPHNSATREALGALIRSQAVVGDAWLFPANRDPSKALTKLMAGYYLGRAEKAADLPHQKRGGWHAFRRAWASRRRHLPVQDVMKAGGWRDAKALQAAYHQADPKTVRDVMDLG